MVSVLNIPESHKLKVYFLVDGDVHKMHKQKEVGSKGERLVFWKPALFRKY